MELRASKGDIGGSIEVVYCGATKSSTYRTTCAKTGLFYSRLGPLFPLDSYTGVLRPPLEL